MATTTGITWNEGQPLEEDALRSLEARVESLLARMTLEEKIALVHGDSKFSTAPIPRLGIPRRWLTDGPHGVRQEVGPHTWTPAGRTDDFSTYMPVDVCLAATWNPGLAEEYGAVLGEEARARGKHVLLGPGVNVMRTPLNGRNFEYFGEDPHLASRMVVGYIRGVQSQQVAACVKHFAANNQEHERTTIDVRMDDRTLREIYLPAFKAAVQEAGVWTVMGAYNKFRGQYCCHNDFLLNAVLKREWGFEGLVVSDWAGAHDTDEAVRCGLDLEMGTEKPYPDYYLSTPFLEGIRSGKYPEELLDDKARRNLRVMIATGALDGREPGFLNTSDHQETARRVAEEGIVLLKNEGGLLPLDCAKTKSIAVIGQNAILKFAAGGDSAGVKAFYEVTALEGIVGRAGEKVNVCFSLGYAPDGGAELIERAVEAARQADVVILVAGLNHDKPYDTEGADRPDMKLPFGQDALIQKVVEANPRTIVANVSGAPVDMEAWFDRIPAVLQAWYAGMEGGAALARVLFGDVNPSGKLPCTFPRRLEDSPAHALDAYPGRDGVTVYEEGLFVGYRWFDAKEIAPRLPFGHGLSYTAFAYENLRLAEADGRVTVRFDLVNAGGREGAEVAQVYVEDVAPRLPRPLRELKAFQKVLLGPGERRTVTLDLEPEAFAFFDPEQNAWVAEPGEFRIHVGGSSRDLRLTESYRAQRGK